MLPRKSFAMVQTGVRTLEPREVEIPDIDAFSAILELEACGICGSDLHMTEDPKTFGIGQGVVLGHEFAGEVIDLGKGVERLKKGDLVSVVPIASCGKCPSR